MPDATGTREWAKNPGGGPGEQDREIKNPKDTSDAPSRVYVPTAKGDAPDQDSTSAPAPVMPVTPVVEDDLYPEGAEPTKASDVQAAVEDAIDAGDVDLPAPEVDEDDEE